MVSVKITWEPFTQETLPFARTVENWYAVTKEASNDAWFAKLRSPDYYKTGRVPDYILIAPVFVRLKVTVESDSPPSAFFTVGARGTFILPMTETGVVIPVLGIGAAQKPIIQYQFDYIVPITTPTSAKEPVWASVFVITEGKEVYSERKEFTVLAQRLTPKLDPKAAAQMVGQVTASFYESTGLDLIYGLIKDRVEETRRIPGRDQVSDALQKWYRQSAQPFNTITGATVDASSGTILDRLIYGHKMFSRLNYTYDYAEFVYTITTECASTWAQVLADAFVKDVQAGKWSGLRATYVPAPTAVAPTGTASVYQVSDPGGEYGDSYKLVFPAVGDAFIETAQEDRMLVLEAVRQPEELRRQEWEKFVLQWNSAIAAVGLLTRFISNPTERTPQFGQTAPLGDVEGYWKWVPTYPLAEFGIKIPEYAKPVLSSAFTYSTYDLRVISKLLEDTVFKFWSGDLERRFGDVRKYAEYKTMHSQAVQVMQWWGSLNTRFTDSQQVILRILEDLKAENRPDLVQAYHTMYMNAREGLQFERLPDWIFMVPPVGWFIGRAERYGIRGMLESWGIDIKQKNWTWEYLTRLAGQEIGVGPSTQGPHYTTTLLLPGGEVINAAQYSMYLTDLLFRIRSGSASEEELIEAQRVCTAIYDSSEARGRFPNVYNSATFVLQALDESGKWLKHPAYDKVYKAPVEDAIFSLRTTVVPESIVAEFSSSPYPLVGTDPRQLAQSLILLQARELEKELDAKAPVTAKERDEMLAKIEAFKQGLPDYLRAHMEMKYTISAEALGSAVEDFLAEVVSGKLFRDFAQTPGSPLLQQATLRIVDNPQVWGTLTYNSFLSGVPGLIQRLQERVYSSEEALDKDLKEELSKLWSSSISVAARTLGKETTDWLEIRRLLEQYAEGYALWHHGQRLVGRTIISILF